MNKIFYLILSIALFGCGVSKPKIQTTKTVHTHKPKKKITPEDKIIIDETERKSEELVATSKVKVTAEVVAAYINDFKTVAKDNMIRHGIPASITLAQGILESGAGTGRLATIANNHFGIKCHKEWKGENVSHDDDAPQECFRKYVHPQESFRDHSLFLTSRPWYAPLFKLPKNDYKAWAYGLKKAGYATDPKYPNKLISLIERYQLQKYDAEVLGITFEEPTQTIAKTEVKPLEKPKATTSDATHTVAQGETLYSISKKYNTTVDQLKAINNLADNAISIGQTLIIR